MKAGSAPRVTTAVLVLALGVAAIFAVRALRRSTDAPPPAATETGEDSARARVVAFWQKYRAATELRLASRLTDAAAGYEDALALAPDHEDARYYLGHVRLELGEFAAAEREWRRLSEVNPASARAHLQLGTLYLCLDEHAPTDLEQAAAEFRRAHEINKEETGAVLRLGEIALALRDRAGASEQFTAVIGSNPGSVPAHFYLGYLAWESERGAEALDRFSSAVALAGATPHATGLSEGDTKRGADPMTLAPTRCRDLEGPLADLETVAPDAVSQELDRRYTALRTLLAEARQRDRGLH